MEERLEEKTKGKEWNGDLKDGERQDEGSGIQNKG